MVESMTDDQIKDLIRMGHKSREFESDKEFWLGRGFSLEEIDRAIKLCKEYESGKLHIEMTPEDKKRLIKENIALYKRLSFSDNETEDIVRDVMKNFITSTSKSRTDD